ncbi:MAG: type VI secretion system tube protein Hcp [Fimbriimonadaceae bacterium]|nr:type VI secretion system tube protein Hcp [Fimbriimonadaceae bacterium]
MFTRLSITWILACAALAASADTVSLTLKSNGAIVPGESQFASLGRANTIDCFSFDLKAALATSAASGIATGRRNYAPIKFVKRIDKASVMIWKALTQNEMIDATFNFYRPNPNGGEQLYYTVRLTQARVTGFHQFTPQASDPKNIGFAVWEEVEITFGAIVCEYVGGIQHQDSLRSGGPPLGRVPPPGVTVHPHPKPDRS